ncbi:hypothetical protein BJ742DRAFT_834847 [Cladochytrium replicatum]|nr:hypothetical protein BJ742DRAFT_834847 [Cladochytrium replicatum]
MHQNYTASPPLFVVGSISWVICWLGVTFTTSYRASLIVFVGGRRPWLLPLILILCQGALSFTGSAYFTINFISSFGKTVDERSTIITIVESIWYSVMESLLFVITQYRIVSVRSSVKKVPLAVQAQLYMKGILRSALYSLNVIMMFISVGNGFGVGVGGNWSVYGHAITLLILMTDSNRFQETIAILNGDHQPRRTGVPTTGQTLSHQETSVHGHTFSDKGNDHHHNSKEQIPRKSAVAHH